MVYNDYELVSTKRVSKQRRKGNILLRRQFEAAGGVSTLFTMGMFGYTGHLLKAQRPALT